MVATDHTRFAQDLIWGLRVIEGYGALPAFGLLDQLQVGDTGPAESTRRGNLQRVGLLFLGSRDSISHQNINSCILNGYRFGFGNPLPRQLLMIRRGCKYIVHVYESMYCVGCGCWPVGVCWLGGGGGRGGFIYQSFDIPALLWKKFKIHSIPLSSQMALPF
jgi:hypothetical protein